MKSVLSTSYRNAALLGLSFRSWLEAAKNSCLGVFQLSSTSVCRVHCDEGESWSEDGVLADRE